MNQQILDSGRRAARTAIQAILAFLTLAPVYLTLASLVHAPDGSNLAIYVATSIAWVGAVSASLAKVMALPAVNDLLAKIGLDGHSGDATGSDSWTTALPILAQRQGGAHAIAKVDAYR